MTELAPNDRPWLSLYGDNATTLNPPAEDMLTLFRQAVHQAPDEPAVIYFDRQLSYRELDELSDSVAVYLRTRGFGDGDRLGLFLQAVPQFLIGLLAGWKAAGVVVPINPMYRERELATVLNDSGACAMICHQRSWHHVVRDAIRDTVVDIVLTTSERDFQTRNDTRLLSPDDAHTDAAGTDLLQVAEQYRGRTPQPVSFSAADTALLSYTSGTSGAPKGAMNTHGNLTFNAENLRAFQGLPPGARVFGLAPLFHITGMVCQVAAAIRIASPLILTYRFDPGVVLEAIAEHHPYMMIGPPTAYIALMSSPQASPDHFKPVELLYSGGAPLPAAVVEAFSDKFDRRLRNGYGLTETTAPCIVEPPWHRAPVDKDSNAVSIGLPMFDTNAWIIDDVGARLGAGKVGELVIEGPMVIPAYWKKPSETRAALPAGCLHTGDVGFMDEEGWFYIIDRKKDMINAAGFKVWPREIEDVLYTHPAVREAAVVGVPDAYRGETVKAFVALDPSQEASSETLMAFCRGRLAAYKCPREVEVHQELPKTASGKILRRAFRSSDA